MEDGKSAGNSRVSCAHRCCQLAEKLGSLLWGNWSLSGSQSLRPHYFHLHPVPHPVILQEERRTGLTWTKCKQGSRKDAVYLLPPPTCSLCSFCFLYSCLLSCFSHCCLLPNPPYLPSSPFLLPNSSEFPHPGALCPESSWFSGLVPASGSVGGHVCTRGFAAHGWHSINI